MFLLLQMFLNFIFGVVKLLGNISLLLGPAVKLCWGHRHTLSPGQVSPVGGGALSERPHRCPAGNRSWACGQWECPLFLACGRFGARPFSPGSSPTRTDQHAAADDCSSWSLPQPGPQLRLLCLGTCRAWKLQAGSAGCCSPLRICFPSLRALPFMADGQHPKEIRVNRVPATPRLEVKGVFNSLNFYWNEYN